MLSRVLLINWVLAMWPLIGGGGGGGGGDPRAFH